MSLSFWFTSRPWSILKKSTWHVGFGFAVLFGQSWYVEVDIFSKRLALGLNLTVEGVNSEKEGIWDKSDGFEVELGFENVLRISELDVEGVLGFGLLVVGIGFVFS